MVGTALGELFGDAVSFPSLLLQTLDSTLTETLVAFEPRMSFNVVTGSEGAHNLFKGGTLTLRAKHLSPSGDLVKGDFLQRLSFKELAHRTGTE